jgi:hypothetical protein
MRGAPGQRRAGRADERRGHSDRRHPVDHLTLIVRRESRYGPKRHYLFPRSSKTPASLPSPNVVSRRVSTSPASPGPEGSPQAEPKEYATVIR